MSSSCLKRTQLACFIFRATPATCPARLCQQSFTDLMAKKHPFLSLVTDLLAPCKTSRSTRSRKPESYSVAFPGTLSTVSSGPGNSLASSSLPALHSPRRDRRARRQVDHHHQPVAGLNTIAPDGP